ncbi:hypothetical protein GGTG_03761 [Gaeumannomyces tritici R3-111a-1]|uniref:Uncharacterized protein n=1 Tax=Gaeumannomyces tritici (strain R3-111a-1) TaxID=644352 RepID=J3NR56_GAET3|nr:hypothetical protein GGTG_03761 [Gaeumannomyces tritici R3-111a-1]EJT78662.1 hypothetical protein GGTG_03761 [Gaeumannomyces tritici R3-111a-1]
MRPRITWGPPGTVRDSVDAEEAPSSIFRTRYGKRLDRAAPAPGFGFRGIGGGSPSPPGLQPCDKLVRGNPPRMATAPDGETPFARYERHVTYTVAEAPSI